MRLALARSDRLEASADKNHRADIEAVLMSAAPRPLYLSSRSMPGDFPFANLVFHPAAGLPVAPPARAPIGQPSVIAVRIWELGRLQRGDLNFRTTVPSSC